MISQLATRVGLAALAFVLAAGPSFADTKTEVLSGGARQNFTDNAAHVFVTSTLHAHNVAEGALETSNGGTTRYFSSTGDKQCGSASTQIPCGGGLLKKVSNATGTTITVQAWDTASATCNTGTQLSGVYTLVNSAPPLELGWEYSAGLCLTIGGTTPTVTTVTLP